MRPVTSNNSHRHIGNCAIFYLKTTTTSLCEQTYLQKLHTRYKQACHTLQLTFCGRQNTLLHLSYITGSHHHFLVQAVAYPGGAPLQIFFKCCRKHFFTTVITKIGLFQMYLSQHNKLCNNLGNISNFSNN